MLNFIGQWNPVRCLPVIPGRDCLRQPNMPADPKDSVAPPIPLEEIARDVKGCFFPTAKAPQKPATPVYAAPVTITEI